MEKLLPSGTQSGFLGMQAWVGPEFFPAYGHITPGPACGVIRITLMPPDLSSRKPRDISAATAGEFPPRMKYDR